MIFILYSVFIVEEVTCINNSFGTNELVEQAVKEYSDIIFNVAYHHLKNYADAQDVTQEVIIKLLERQKGFESKEYEKAWVIRVTLNSCKDLFRTFWRKRVVSLDERFDEPVIQQDSVLSSVLALPPKHRTVVYLYYYEGYSVKEIACILQINEHTVQSRLHRARESLKREMEEINFEQRPV
ncbi:MAG: sigma-70 family RNA polymerase sigma factor [Eubacteriales bacterium]|nr:sigma-70 family RNA polymerase sigma factor [Oscillospiraceae bacterium]MDD4493767.1 sigma-70 family RNA polymerase sigma factor [Eubacteriales bacterium]